MRGGVTWSGADRESGRTLPLWFEFALVFTAARTPDALVGDAVRMERLPAACSWHGLRPQPYSLSYKANVSAVLGRSSLTTRLFSAEHPNLRLVLVPPT